jgi:hypothetical protein
VSRFLYFSCCSLESFVLVTVRPIEANFAVFSSGLFSSWLLRSFLFLFCCFVRIRSTTLICGVVCDPSICSAVVNYFFKDCRLVEIVTPWERERERERESNLSGGGGFVVLVARRSTLSLGDLENPQRRHNCERHRPIVAGSICFWCKSEAVQLLLAFVDWEIHSSFFPHGRCLLSNAF